MTCKFLPVNEVENIANDVHNWKKARRVLVLLVYFSLVLDNMLLTVVGKYMRLQ